MRRIQTLTAALLIGLLAMPLASFAQAAPRRAVARPIVAEARAFRDSSPYSKYSITANTTDGGRVEFLFIWQRLTNWRLRGFSGLLIVDTPPVLHMAKYDKNGSLEMGITYVPLFVMQYNDSDGNGLFDLWTRGYRGFSDEMEDEEVDWERLRDRPYRVYPLAPMFQMVHRQRQWEWAVSPLVNETIVVNNTETKEFSWTVSATVPSIPWIRAYEVEEGESLLRRTVEWTTIDIAFGYHVRLLPENPEVKYDLGFANTGWAEAENLRLAMVSSIFYNGAEPVVVRLGQRGFKAFNQTVAARAPIFIVSEKAMEAARAFVSYTPEALVDGATVEDAIRTAIHPAFLLPMPVVVPEGLYTKGIITDIEGVRASRNYIAFAHQVSVPRFENSLSHDPAIGIVTELSTVTLSTLPSDLISLRLLAVVAAAALVATTAYLLASKRRQGSKADSIYERKLLPCV